MKPNLLGTVFAVNLALAGALVYFWSDPARSAWSEPAALPPSLDEIAVAAAPAPIDVSAYRETLARPLFAANRRPAPKVDPAEATAEVVDLLKDVRLVGLYGSAGRGGAVLVNAGKTQRLAFGERIGDWTLSGEEGRSASLVRANGERRQLQMALNTTAPAKATPDAKMPAELRAQAEEGARASSRSSSGTGRRAAAPRGSDSGQVPGAADPAAREQEMRQRLERLNARRAQRGLAPLTE
jgi:hypothetical protein